MTLKQPTNAKGSSLLEYLRVLQPFLNMDISRHRLRLGPKSKPAQQDQGQTCGYHFWIVQSKGGIIWIVQSNNKKRDIRQ